MSRPEPRPDARAVALDLVGAVLRHGRALDDALSGNRPFAQLAPRDRALAHRLTATVLRRCAELDARIDPLMTRRPARGELRDILRLGAAQLTLLDTPAHAAVDSAVTLARRRRLAGVGGLVNAVLRRLATTAADSPVDPDRAARLNTPDWLWHSWCRAHGSPRTARIARAHLDEPPLDLAVPRDPALWAARLGGTPLANGLTVRRPTGGGPIDRLPGFAEGAWWVQDVAASLPARLLGNVTARTVIDLCAAPGGKTAQLAAAGADVIAVDLSEDRLARVTDTLARLGLRASIVAADATTWDAPLEAEAILLDAPCTATGTIRRHPDIPYLKRPGDLAPAAHRQSALLDAAAARLAPGGTLVYATCSLQPEEGEEQIAALLGRNDSLKTLPIAVEETAGLGVPVESLGAVRTFPGSGTDSGDGFFIARLTRAAKGGAAAP